MVVHRMYELWFSSSSGLLLPKIVVDDFGGTRSDPGMLGAGIYFAGSARYVVYNIMQTPNLICILD